MEAHDLAVAIALSEEHTIATPLRALRRLSIHRDFWRRPGFLNAMLTSL